jgi:methionyl-tRNA formyltransferase
VPTNPTKIIFFGTSEFAVPALKSLINFGYKVEMVVTQPEKPLGRARVVVPSPVKKTALELNLLVAEPHNLKEDEEFFNRLKHLNPDLCIIASYGKIIPKQYLDTPKYGFINIHPSLLPKYRGPSPIQTAIINGDKKTGVVIIRIDEKMDHGPILGSIEYQVLSIKGYKEIEEELAAAGAELLIDTLPKYLGGEIKPQEQDDSNATFTKLLTRPDGRIDWHKTAEDIFNQIRALNPEPGTWTTWQDKTMNISEAEILDKKAGEEPGTIVNVDNKIAVATSKCYLILKQIQPEGKKEMDAKAFLNGHPDFLGSVLG